MSEIRPRKNFGEIMSHFQNVKQLNSTQHVANCPCCNDSKQHLYINYDSKSSKVMLDCKRGCSFNDIVGSAGLKSEDMFLSNSYGTVGKYTKIEKPVEPSQPRKLPEKVEKDIENKGKVVETREYIYQNANNSIFGKKEVKKYENGDKCGFWYKFNPEKNGYISGLNGEKAPPYNLNVVANTNKCVFVVEGEKDVETLRKLGLVATTSPNGAGAKWNPEHTPYFKDKDVVVITDNDNAGKNYGKNVADNLSPVTKSLKIIPSEFLATAVGINPYSNLRLKDLQSLLIATDKVGENSPTANLR
jgi:hypothetical protein